MFNPGQEISTIDFGAIIGGSLNAVITAQSQSANTTVDFIKNVGFNTSITKDENGNEVESHTPIGVAFTYDKVTSPAQIVTDRTYTVSVVNGGSNYTKGTNKDYHLMAGMQRLDIDTIEFDESTKTVKSITLQKVPDSVELANGQTLNLIYDGDGTNEGTGAELQLVVDEKTTSVPAVVQKMQIQVPILTMMPIPFIKIEHADIDFNVKINSVSNISNTSTSNTKVDASHRNSFFGRTQLSASFSNQKSSSSSEEVKKDYSLNISIHAVQDDMPAGVSRILDILEESVTSTPMATA